MTLGMAYITNPRPGSSLGVLDVGTALYIAPELQSRRKGPRNSAKADMYSLGVCACIFVMPSEF